MGIVRVGIVRLEKGDVARRRRFRIIRLLSMRGNPPKKAVFCSEGRVLGLDSIRIKPLLTEVRSMLQSMQQQSHPLALVEGVVTNSSAVSVAVLIGAPISLLS